MVVNSTGNAHPTLLHFAKIAVKRQVMLILLAGLVCDPELAAIQKLHKDMHSALWHHIHHNILLHNWDTLTVER